MIRTSKIALLLTVLFSVVVMNACKKDSEENERNQEAPIRPVTANSNAYVTSLFEYLPAPGQLINTTAGNMDAANSVLSKEGLVSLGAFGGRIILGFDHTVINQSDQNDLLILGNASSSFAEPGVVYVMQDENGNGQPDDTWYEIAGSETGNEGYNRAYSVTYTRPDQNGDVAWKDNAGYSGVVKSNSFHTQSYYPSWITESSYTLSGTLLPSSNIDETNSSLVTSKPFAYGYADNTPEGDELDIDQAIDKDGQKVHLKGVDFIKIQTAIQYNLGWLGELSTEVRGVADLSLYAK